MKTNIAFIIKTLLLILCFLLLTVYFSFAQNNKISLRFTSFFVDEKIGDFDAYFIKIIKDPSFQSENATLIETELSKIVHFNLKKTWGQPLDASSKSKDEAGTIYIRGMVTRADVKKVEHFTTDEYVFNTNVTIEIFDLVTGEVFYTRTLTGQVFEEHVKTKAMEENRISSIFKECLNGTIKALIKRIGEEYVPGIIEGIVLKLNEDKSIVIDLGKNNGIYQGMTFYLYDNSTPDPVGLLKTGKPQEKFSIANMVIEPPNKPQRGWKVKSYGVNKLIKQKGQSSYMVTNFSVAAPENLPQDFKVDNQSLGQWLHDGLSKKTDLFLLAPLLVELSEDGLISMQQALWDAQTKFSLFSGISRSKTIGNRAFPDVMIRGLITHASIQSFSTPAADNKILEVAVSIEFYNRKTREFLYCCQHSGRKVEKIVKQDGKVYRDLNIETSFRDLCEHVINETCAKIDQEYKPIEKNGSIVELKSSEIFNVKLNHQAAKGEIYNLIRPADKIKAINGQFLGNLWLYYGIAKIINTINNNIYEAEILVSDGKTKIKEQDILVAEGNSEILSTGKLLQVKSFIMQGKVLNEYQFSSNKLKEWLHNALLSTGKYRILPPDFRQSQADNAEVALASGQFQMADTGEIIYQGIQQPDILVSGRLGLLDVATEVGDFKDILTLRSGVEVTFTDPNGNVLFSKKLAGSRELKQIKARGEVQIGTNDLNPEFDSLTKNTINELVQKIANVYEAE